MGEFLFGSVVHWMMAVLIFDYFCLLIIFNKTMLYVPTILSRNVYLYFLKIRNFCFYEFWNWGGLDRKTLGSILNISYDTKMILILNWKDQGQIWISIILTKNCKFLKDIARWHSQILQVHRSVGPCRLSNINWCWSFLASCQPWNKK